MDPDSRICIDAAVNALIILNQSIPEKLCCLFPVEDRQPIYHISLDGQNKIMILILKMLAHMYANFPEN